MLKNIQRLFVPKLRSYESVIAEWDYDKINTFFESNDVKASDFQKDIVHKKHKGAHETLLTLEKAGKDLLEGSLDGFNELLSVCYGGKISPDSVALKGISDQTSHEKTLKTYQKAKVTYAEKLEKWSISTNGYSGQGHYNNVNTVASLYKDALVNLVEQNHRAEAEETLKSFRSSKFTDFIQSYKYSGSSHCYFSTLAGDALNSEDKKQNKLGGFLADSLKENEKDNFIQNYGFPTELKYNATSETQADLLERFVKSKHRKDMYLGDEAINAISDSLKSESGKTGPLQKKAFALYREYSGHFSDRGNDSIRQIEIKEVQKGNNLFFEEYLKDAPSFMRFYSKHNDGALEMKDFAKSLSYDDDGNETKAKPYVVNALLDELSRVAENKNKRYDVRSGYEWSNVSDAVEAVAVSDTSYDAHSLTILYELQMKRHDNNLEFIENMRAGIPDYVKYKEKEMRAEKFLMTGAMEALEAVKARSKPQI